MTQQIFPFNAGSKSFPPLILGILAKRVNRENGHAIAKQTEQKSPMERSAMTVTLTHRPLLVQSKLV
jgi:hypothetical protein